jgi:hypothetical protein
MNNILICTHFIPVGWVWIRRRRRRYSCPRWSDSESLLLRCLDTWCFAFFLFCLFNVSTIIVLVPSIVLMQMLAVTTRCVPACSFSIRMCHFGRQKLYELCQDFGKVAFLNVIAHGCLLFTCTVFVEFYLDGNFWIIGAEHSIITILIYSCFVYSIPQNQWQLLIALVVHCTGIYLHPNLIRVWVKDAGDTMEIIAWNVCSSSWCPDCLHMLNRKHLQLETV